VAILDIAMPLLNGIETGRAITRACPSTRTIALTVHTENHMSSARYRRAYAAMFSRRRQPQISSEQSRKCPKARSI
jgi:DNA-binding NarL/FixJ family response regulator